MIPRTPSSTLFPYTTLFRSSQVGAPAYNQFMWAMSRRQSAYVSPTQSHAARCTSLEGRDQKSTRLNSSHVENSYAVFCFKKKKKKKHKKTKTIKKNNNISSL